MLKRLAWSLCFLTASVSGASNFGPISVPGTAVVFDPDQVLTQPQLAALASTGNLGATPAVKVVAFTAGSGQTVTFSASGLIGCCGKANSGPDGADGSSGIAALGSISGFAAPSTVPLVGVFTNGSPSGAPPANFDYSGGLGQASYSPLLNQVFFIGDGLTGTGSGATQVFNVPSGATELWLGVADANGFGGSPGFYGDNPGSFSVSGTFSGNAAQPLLTPAHILWFLVILLLVIYIFTKRRRRL